MNLHEAIKLIADDRYSDSRRIKRFLETPEGLLLCKRLETYPADAHRLEVAVSELNWPKICEIKQRFLTELQFKTVKELKQLAAERGVPYYGTLTKDELIRELKGA